MDNNNNGIQDANEPDGNLPAGVVIQGFYQGQDTILIKADTVDANGNYTFNNIDCTKIFNFHIAAPTNYAVTGSKENGDGTGSNPTIVNFANFAPNNTKLNAGKDGIISKPSEDIYNRVVNTITYNTNNLVNNVVNTITNSNSNTNTNENPTYTIVERTTSPNVTGDENVNTNYVTQETKITNVETNLPRTGALNTALYATLASSSALVGFIFMSKRNKRFVSSMKRFAKISSK
jgi:hypothetical protein